MTQTSNRLFDEFARLMTDATNVAQGVRREAETAMRTQMERWINELDLVKREEFEVVREMASTARAENQRLEARIAELETRLGEAKPKRTPRSTAKSRTATKAAVRKSTGSPEDKKDGA